MLHRGVHADIDDATIRGAVEEPGHAPGFICKRVHDLQARLLHTGKCFTYVIHEDRDVRIDRRRGVFGHQAELVSMVIAKGDDPSMVHEHTKPVRSGVFPSRSREIGDRQVRDHSFNTHDPIVSSRSRYRSRYAFDPQDA